MKKLFLLFAFVVGLLFNSQPLFGQQTAVGYFVQADCSTISFVRDNAVICIQTETGSGRNAGEYKWNGTAWIKSDGVYVQTAAPTQCQIGEIWFDSDAVAGQNIYAATAINPCVWTLQGAAPAPPGLTGHVFRDEGGAPLTQRSDVNCVGTGITCSDVGGQTQIAVAAGAESDPIVGAITGVAKGDGAGNIAAANATDLPFTPSGTIAANTVGGAIAELDGETQTALSGKQPVDADLTALAGNATAGFWAAATNVARSMATASANNIIITNPTGAVGNPTWDAGPNVFLTTRSHTQTAGDIDFGSAASLGVPMSAGAAPTTSRRIAYDSTSNRLKYGANGVTFTIAHNAEVQPINANLTALAGLTGANNVIPRFTGPGAMSNLTLIPCTDTNGQHYNFDGTNFVCGTSTSGALSGGTPGTLLKYATPTTAADSIITEAAGVATIGGGLVVGSLAGGSWEPDGSAYAGMGNVALTMPYVGGPAAFALTTGALVPTEVVKIGANGQLISGGAAGAGDVTLTGAQELEDKTFDEANGNIFKVTKSVQVELFGPTDDNAAAAMSTTGTGLYYFIVPVSLNGTVLTGIQARVAQPGTTGTVQIQIYRCVDTATGALCSGTTAAMLTTVASIDSGENSTASAATPASVNAANDDVATGQVLQFVVPTIHTTPAKGLVVNLDFKLP